MISYIFIVFLLYIPFIYSIDFSKIEKYNVPEVDFDKLYSFDKEAINTMMNSLFTEGVISISNIPNFKQAKDLALEGLSQCLLKNYLLFNKNEESEMPFYSEMYDNSIRLSLGAKYENQEQGEIKNKCGENSKQLREIVNFATQTFFSLLDSQIITNNPIVMEPYFTSFTSLMKDGKHLEHLHSYFGSNQEKNLEEEFVPTMNLHTDLGFLIAMTTGHFNQGTHPSPVSGLYLKLSDGRLVKAISSDSSLLILLGEGASKWIDSQHLFSRTFRTMPHLLLNDLPAKQTDITRSWYGMMFRPPSSAIIPSVSSSFEDYNIDVISTSAKGFDRSLYENTSSDLTVVPIGCKLDDGSDGVECWAQCTSVADLPCGTSAVCYDTATDTYNDGTTMCHTSTSMNTCELRCVDNTNNATVNSFCYGTGTSMFMDGFHAIGTEDDGTTACVNLLFPEWTLDDKSKYAIACIFTFAFGLLIQFFGRLRILIISTPKSSKGSSFDDKVSNFVYGIKVKFGEDFCLLIQKSLSVLIYGIHVTFGYFAMLIAMTYSVELFCMIVSGLTIGYAIFHLDLKDHVASTDACCPDTSHSKNFEVNPDKIIETNNSTITSSTETSALKKDVENCCGNYNFDD